MRGRTSEIKISFIVWLAGLHVACLAGQRFFASCLVLACFGSLGVIPIGLSPDGARGRAGKVVYCFHFGW